MARSFDATQTSIVGSDVKVEVSWLFEIDTNNDGTPEYYYSTKSKTYDAQPYSAKILGFSSITMRRGASESGIQAPSRFSFSISNASNALNASAFEGAGVTVKLVINDGSNETIICTWAFEVIGYSGTYQKITLECRDWLQKYLEGDYPNTAMIGALFPSDDPKPNMCVPVVYGTPYIPIPSIYKTDKRYYLIGKHNESLGSEDLSNIGFEDAGAGGADIWADWTETASDGALANETTVVHGGSNAAKITAGSSVDTNIKQTFTPSTGRIHKLVFWARGDGTHSIRYRIEDDTNSEDIVAITSAGVTAAEYTQVTVYFTVPYNCTSVNLYFFCPDTDTAYGYVDDVSIKPDEQYTITEVRSPKEHNSQSVWTSGAGYKFEYYRIQGSDSAYYVGCRYIIADVDRDGTADDNGLFNGGEYFLPAPTKFTDANTSSYTNPGDWINQILQDMGVPSAKIDSTTLTAVKGTFTGWALTFNGGWWYKMSRKKLLAKLLTMCNLELIIRDKIYFKVHSKTSQQTITSAYIMKNNISGEGSFTVSPLVGNERKDSGMCHYQEPNVPIDRMVEILVPAKSSTSYISNEIIECDFIQDDQDASAIAQLALQRKLLSYQRIGFTVSGKLLKLEADNVVTISGDNYGGEGSTYPVLIDEIRYNKDCSLDISATRYSDSLDDYGDLSPSAVTVAADDTTISYSPVVQGPASPLSADRPNQITETVYIVAGGDLILEGDDSDPATITFYGSTYSVTFGERLGVGGLFEILPSTSDLQYFWIGGSGGTLNWKTVKMMAYDSCLMSSIGANNYFGAVYTDSSSGSDAIVRLRVGKTATADRYLEAKYDDSPATLYFRPVTDNVWELGGSSNRFSNFYCVNAYSAFSSIDQGEGDGEILELKSTDVEHGMTSVVSSTNTYGSFQKQNAGYGGLRINSLSESIIAFFVVCAGTSEDTETSTSAQGAAQFYCGKKDGTTLQAYGADANIFVVGNLGDAKFIVKGDGDIYYDGADQGAYDIYEDALACSDLSNNLSKQFGKVIKYNREDLHNMGVISFTQKEDDEGNIKESTFVSLKGLTMLQLGAVGELFRVCQSLCNHLGISYEEAKKFNQGEK